MRRVVHFVAHEFGQMLPPTLFFLVGFNLIVLTGGLVLEQYGIRLFNFLLATTAALIVGKSVLVANKLPVLRRFDEAPLLVPILWKAGFYTVVTLLARLLEASVHFAIETGSFTGFGAHLAEAFSWRRFAAVQTWTFVLFLIYVAAVEVSRLFPPGALRRAMLDPLAAQGLRRVARGD